MLGFIMDIYADVMDKPISPKAFSVIFMLSILLLWLFAETTYIKAEGLTEFEKRVTVMILKQQRADLEWQIASMERQITLKACDPCELVEADQKELKRRVEALDKQIEETNDGHH